MADVALLELVGTGGLGALHRAQEPDGTIVAVKVPDSRYRRHLSGPKLDALIHSLAQADSTHLAVPRRVTSVGGAPVLVSDFVPNSIDLCQLAFDRRIPVRAGLEIVAKAAIGTAEGQAHSGLPHGGIKPQNILVTSKGSVVVTDFGLLEATGVEDDPDATLFFAALGYQAPEAFRGPPGLSSDTFALARVLWELATRGRAPTTEMLLAGYTRQLQGLEAALHRVVPDQTALIELVMDSLAFLPEDRPDLEVFAKRAAAAAGHAPGLPLRDWARELKLG